MIAAATFGDVMQQNRDIQSAPAGDFVNKARRTRVIAFELASLDLAGKTNRPDGVLIDGIVVIHVKLHLRIDLAKIWHKAPKYARLIEPAQHGFRIIMTR